jgi:hypothetical protein
MARLLRPLVRLYIHSATRFPGLSHLLRELFVNVAEHDFVLKEKEQTDSRLRLLTGIDRKEVARLRGAGALINEAPATLKTSCRCPRLGFKRECQMNAIWSGPKTSRPARSSSVPPVIVSITRCKYVSQRINAAICSAILR